MGPSTVPCGTSLIDVCEWSGLSVIQEILRDILYL